MGILTEKEVKKIISKWYIPRKPIIKLPYLWSPKEILIFAEKNLYKLKTIDRAILTLIWYLRRDIARLNKLSVDRPNVIRNYRGKLSYDYKIKYQNVDFLTLALYSRIKFKKECRKKARNLSTRGPNHVLLNLLKQQKKWDDDDKLIFSCMFIWWGMIFWDIIRVMYLEIFDWPAPLSMSEEFYNMRYMWYKINHDFRILVETAENLEQIKNSNITNIN